MSMGSIHCPKHAIQTQFLSNYGTVSDFSFGMDLALMIFTVMISRDGFVTVEKWRMIILYHLRGHMVPSEKWQVLGEQLIYS